ncbi:hypothetical protein Pmani_029982 [Petrolisthes manimaculis]|uniref:Uncharacterized protein n=1 Tax=Petrolisthes manimaculis TaxID=1843537 RepID=A0AAE1NWI1_9EUCA|nr:hypothetical protein Pmani_029982 [Petrolisthes manimaculis]
MADKELNRCCPLHDNGEENIPFPEDNDYQLDELTRYMAMNLEHMIDAVAEVTIPKLKEAMKKVQQKRVNSNMVNINQIVNLNIINGEYYFDVITNTDHDSPPPIPRPSEPSTLPSLPRVLSDPLTLCSQEDSLRSPSFVTYSPETEKSVARCSPPPRSPQQDISSPPRVGKARSVPRLFNEASHSLIPTYTNPSHISTISGDSVSSCGGHSYSEKTSESTSSTNHREKSQTFKTEGNLSFNIRVRLSQSKYKH